MNRQWQPWRWNWRQPVAAALVCGVVIWAAYQFHMSRVTISNGTARIEYTSSRVLILRKASPFTASDAPVNGVQYAVGATVGGATVVKTDATPTTGFEQTGLASSTTVYYKVFARAGQACYSAGSTSTISSPALSSCVAAPLFVNSIV